MSKWRIPWSQPWITREDRAAVARVLRSGRLACGPEVEALEDAFAKAHGYRFGVAMCNGMACLRAMYCNTGLFCATDVAGATFPPVYGILENGVCFADLGDVAESSLVTALYDSDLLEPVDSDPMFADYCEAVGTAPTNGCDVAYSFYPNKQLCGGEGGLLLTQDPARAKWYRAYRNNGRTGESWLSAQEGGNYRMPEMTAALIRSQLSRLDYILKQRRVLWMHYHAELNGTWRDDPAPWSCFTYPLECETKDERDTVAWELAKARIETRMPFPASPGCPKWSAWVDRHLLLPFYTRMSEKDQSSVIRIVRGVTR